MTSDSTVS